jgi:hypothetical protein
MDRFKIRMNRTLQIALVILCLGLQVFAAIHAAEHSLHHAHDPICSICLTADITGSATPVAASLITVLLQVTAVLYLFSVCRRVENAPLLAYAARGPPSLTS